MSLLECSWLFWSKFVTRGWVLRFQKPGQVLSGSLYLMLGGVNSQLLLWYYGLLVAIFLATMVMGSPSETVSQPQLNVFLIIVVMAMVPLHIHGTLTETSCHEMVPPTLQLSLATSNSDQENS